MSKLNSLKPETAMVMRVNLREPTAPGRLYYHFDAEIDKHILLIKSAINRRWAYTVNIDNRVLLSIDTGRILGEVEVIVPKRSWKVDTTLPIPHASQSADLEFVEVTHRHEFLELPVKVMTDLAQSYAYILIGSMEQEPVRVELSEKCFALVADDQLCGFFVTLR